MGSKSTVTDDDSKLDNKLKQAVGGRPPRYAPAQACNGSAQRQL